MHSWCSSTLIKIIICGIFPSTSARVQLLVSSQHILQPDSFFRMTRIFRKFKSDIQCMLCNFLFVYLLRCWSYLILTLTIVHSNICSCLGVDPELIPEWNPGPVNLTPTLRKICDNYFLAQNFCSSVFMSMLFLPFTQLIAKAYGSILQQ